MIGLILTSSSSDVLDSRTIISFLLSLGLTIVIYEIYPFIRIVIMKKKYDVQEAKKMAKWNSIIVCLISFLVAIIFFEDARENPSAAMSIPAGYLYYLINKKVWVSKNNKKEKEVQTKKKKKKDDINKPENKDSNNGKFVCSACGAIVKETATKCPKCGETFDDDEKEKNEFTSVCSNCGAKLKEYDASCPNCGEAFINESYNGDNKTDFEKKAADLRKLKELLDDKIITKKEFEEEKGKILK